MNQLQYVIVLHKVNSRTQVNICLGTQWGDIGFITLDGIGSCSFSSLSSQLATLHLNSLSSEMLFFGSKVKESIVFVAANIRSQLLSSVPLRYPPMLSRPNVSLASQYGGLIQRLARLIYVSNC